MVMGQRHAKMLRYGACERICPRQGEKRECRTCAVKNLPLFSTSLPPDNLWKNMFSYHDTFEILDGGGG